MNRADVFEKNSYTRLNDFKFTSITVREPSDTETQLNLVGTLRVKRRLRASGFAGLGTSEVSFSRLDGRFTRNDCAYSFAVSHFAGKLDQQGVCGNRVSLTVNMPNATSLENNIGFIPGDDLAYRSIYWQAGLGLEYRTGRWSHRLGYYLQHFERADIDKRARSFGRHPQATNHSLALLTEFALTRNLSATFSAEYVTNRLLNRIPFMYNSYTAGSFDRSGLFFMTGLRVVFSK